MGVTYGTDGTPSLRVFYCHPTDVRRCFQPGQQVIYSMQYIYVEVNLLLRITVRMNVPTWCKFCSLYFGKIIFCREIIY
jgi:hypothetical protein